MPLTVVGRCRARPGQEEPFIVTALAALVEEPLAVGFSRPIHQYEDVLQPVLAATCTTYRAPPTAADALVAYLKEQAGPAIEAWPGCALRVLYQDTADPANVVSLIGW